MSDDEMGAYSSFLTIASICLLLSGCISPPDEAEKRGLGPEPRKAMRDLVKNISHHAKSVDQGFIVVTQNGNELIFSDDANTIPERSYLASLDGVAQEDLNYGYVKDDEPTPIAENLYLTSMLTKARELNKTVLITDYCWDERNMENAYRSNDVNGFITFAADSRDLDVIPKYPLDPYDVNTGDIERLVDARNFLYLIDPGGYQDRVDYQEALKGTDYDLLIIDLFFEVSELNSSNIAALKLKSNGGSRLVLCYMSVGEAEDYRYYWRSEWKDKPPRWLDRENPEWEGNYKVHYWDSEWQSILFGSEGAYLDRIMDAGFDGVYLDLIDAFEYYEE